MKIAARRLVLAAVAAAALAPAIALPLSAQGRRGGGTRPDQQPPDPTRSAVSGRSGSSPGTISGIVSAKGANGQTIGAANVLVQLWKTDGATSAARDAACSAWLADKDSWMQAKQEIEYPSAINLSGTPVGHDVDLLRTLMSLRRDTVRADANGAFTFTRIPFGAYTVEAEAVANDRFVQWTRDAAVIPIRATRVDLDASTFAENQYCTLVPVQPDTGKIYDAKELDSELVPARNVSPDMLTMPSFRTAASPIRIDFVVDENGAPIGESVRVVSGGIALEDAQKFVESMRYNIPAVHGRPVKARGRIDIRLETTVRRVN
ncbi:MAG: hypothetical protein M3R65_06875 [Gemmatimonadota bacterium]|nr:hypothetical protein [Gemmatimonadota bacterium]